jgi:hypothetical protein
VTPLVQWLLNSIPYVLQLVVGVVGLVVTASTRHRGRGTGLLVTAFVLMMASYLGWVSWGWVETHAPSFIQQNHLSFNTWEVITLVGNIVLGLIEVVAWVMVVLGVLVSRGRQPQPPQPFGAPAAPAGQPGPFSPPPPPGPGGPA